MGDGSGGANTADSYIGSLISLTSKSEIRYEGILYTVDTENSNIALQNVRSFGTEGRKKDGPQILPSEKVYDYIIFRGSDIKDLQVKLSPSIQAPPQPPADPAIISLQSQYSQPSSIAPAYVHPPPGPIDSPQLPYPGIPPPAFRTGVPTLYQPATPLGSWGPPPPPGQNGTGLAMPMYWQGYYRGPSAQTMLQQPLPPQPPSLPGHPVQSHLQQLPSRSVNLLSAMPTVSAQPHYQSSAPSPTSAATSVPPVSVPPAVPSSTSVQAPVSASVSAPTSAPGVVPSSAAVSIPSPVQGVSAVITPAAKNPRRVAGIAQASPPQNHSSGASVGATSVPATSAPQNLVQRSQTATQALPVVSPSGKNPVSNSYTQEQKAAEPPRSSAQPVVSTSVQPPQQPTQPLLPLPVTSTPQKQLVQGNGSVGNNYVRRGRGRGSGSGRGIGLAQPTQQFMEDFDFTAMNEKFNKDEVWGELGKGDPREKVAEVDDEEEETDEGQAAEDDVSDSKPLTDVSKKPVYIKDDFFDSLSCDALDREEGRAERTKFSEQRKIDTETFGNFPLRSRGRGGRGGRRGAYRGGGGYYGGIYLGGRGNGYGRGRGAPRSTTAIN